MNATGRPVTALIADDEPQLARALGEHLARLWPALQVVHVARHGVEAAERIAALQPDLAFLDIQMPGLTGLTGLEVAQGIEGATRVVFVTAYDEYAVQAFEREALDPGQFVQVHRSTIVNLACLSGTRRDEASRLFLHLRGHAHELPVSRAYVHLFKAM